MVSTDILVVFKIWIFFFFFLNHNMKTVRLQALEVPTSNYFSASFVNDPAWAIQLWVIPEGGWMGGGIRERRGAGVSSVWVPSRMEGGEGGLVRTPACRRRVSQAGDVLQDLVALGTEAPACHRASPWSLGLLQAGYGPPGYQPLGGAFQGKRSFCFTVSVWLRNTGKELLLCEHF